MREPLVSVVIPCFNAARYVAETLSSVLAQTYPRLEVIVVDDGSTDGTLDVLHSFREAVTVVRHDRNRGVAAARNTGAGLARGEFLAFVDADDLWTPQKLTRQIEAASEPDVVLLVHTDLGYIDETGAPHPRPWPMWTTADGDCFAELLRSNGVAASAALVRRPAFERCGGFEEGLRGTEDYHLWLRLTLRGRCGGSPSP
ncbi:glycosyltransferase family 2 protein [Deferrisoma camini]|uniref:glycosyltransferase family 2 protein n=1 Tax=Deferrisoma camini TaxID=1035120 RepID=UPI0004B2CB73|nr:glycosyltransferase family A protein [Deferrisoma camini]